MGENYSQYISLTAIECSRTAAGQPGPDTHGPLGPKHSAVSMTVIPQLLTSRDEEQQGPSSTP